MKFRKQHLLPVYIYCLRLLLNLSEVIAAHMELVARKADLVRELQFFQQIVERKNTIPILANVLIEAHRQRNDAAGDRPRSGAAQPLRSRGRQSRAR